jgi:hypothetical protein
MEVQLSPVLANDPVRLFRLSKAMKSREAGPAAHFRSQNASGSPTEPLVNMFYRASGCHLSSAINVSAGFTPVPIL